MDMACHFSLGCCVKNYTYLHAGTLQKVLQQSSHFLPCLLRDLPHSVHLAVWTHINIFDHRPFFQICDCFLMMAVFPLIYWHLSNFKDTRTEYCVTSVSVPSDWNSQTWKERNKKKKFSYNLILNFHFICCLWVHALPWPWCSGRGRYPNEAPSVRNDLLCFSCCTFHPCNSWVFCAEETNSTGIAPAM